MVGARVASIDVAGLDGADCVAGLVAGQRASNILDGLKLRLVAEFAPCREVCDDQPAVPGGETARCGRTSEFAGAEVAVPLGLTRRGGDLLMDLAYTLDRLLPATAAALAAGDIDARRARTIADEVTQLPPELARAVEAAVLPRAGRWTVPALRRAVRRAVLRHAPDRAEEQQRQARAERRAWLSHRADGVSALHVHGPSHHLLRIATAINCVGHTLPAAPQASAEQRRFDALALIADTILDDPTLPATRFGRPGLVLLTGLGVTARARAEQHENEALAATGAHYDPSVPPPDQPMRPAELLGDGPVPDPVVAELAAHRHTPVVRFHPEVTGTCDHTRGHQVPAELARQLAAFWRYCAFPGCGVAAHRRDLDHVIPWPDGPTCGCNLIPLCRLHHRLKTHTAWQLRLHPCRVVEWTSPTGRTKRVYPADDDEAA